MIDISIEGDFILFIMADLLALTFVALDSIYALPMCLKNFERVTHFSNNIIQFDHFLESDFFYFISIFLRM